MLEAPLADLRKEFNEAGYFDSTTGRFRDDLTIEESARRPADPNRPQDPNVAPLPPLPDGTLSVVAHISSNGSPVANVHFDIIPPDWQIRGRPDPKCVVVRGDGTLVQRAVG